MSKIGVSGKIDVTNIDKARLFVGQKGKYLDFTVFIDIDELDQYGNSGMVTQDVTKEEKNQGVKGNILGNVKVFWNDSQTQPVPQQQGGFSGQTGGFSSQQPTQKLHQQQGGFSQQQPNQQQGGFQQKTTQQGAVNTNQGNQSQYGNQQQAPNVNPQDQTIDFDDDIPF